MEGDKNELPTYSAAIGEASAPSVLRTRNSVLQLPRRSRVLRVCGIACIAFIVYAQWSLVTSSSRISVPDANIHGLSIQQLQEDLDTCVKLHKTPVDPIGYGRERNARYVDGHRPTIIKNATVWIGEPAQGTKNFTWSQADVFIEHGLIKEVAKDIPMHSLSEDVLVYDAKGRPLTSGIIDMHSHAAVRSLPTLHGNEDVSELSADITPYVRSIDGIQPTDHHLQVIKSGGVTTSLILPGSSNNIGGQAYVIKHAVGQADGRNETSVADMLADPDHTWRYMKMACGENSKQIHGKAGERGPYSRLGESWEFRRAFEHATKLKREQDDWCRAASSSLDNVDKYLPFDLEWESLVALLRGQVHVHTHCYTINDLEAFIDHTNEFKFPIKAFHHAHQTYLVPEILKRAWGNDPPASALFADNMWYKAEAAIGSEYAGKRLYDAGLVPIYVSDNPVLNAQHVVFEAAKAYKYGLPYHAALASVTSAPAERLGLGKRLGKIKPGFDADIVVWDSDPLSVGASPVQVWIDGAAQYENPIELKKPFEGTIVPDEDLGNIDEQPRTVTGDLVFTNISSILLPMDIDGFAADGKTYNVAISHGKITCVGRCDAELNAASKLKDAVVHVDNGYLSPAFTAFGSTLGLNYIETEKATDNGADGGRFSRGIDGLALGTEKLRVAYRYGVTRAISAPKFTGGGTHHGTSAGFLAGAETVLDAGAIFSRDTALHYTLDLSAKSGVAGISTMSSAVGEIRLKLLEAVESLVRKETLGIKERYSEVAFLRKVVQGKMPLAVTVHSADTIAALVDVKTSVEQAMKEIHLDGVLRLVIIGGAEAHLVADQLAAAGVGVVLAPLQSYAISWDQRRALTGAPLTNGTSIDVLLSAGVITALGLEEDWLVRDLGLLAGVAYRNGEGRINEKDAIDLVSKNLETLLGVTGDAHEHFVIHQGSPLDIGSRVKAVSDQTGKLYVG
ncbi:carbohydrate esterase family 9 protein [Colletotrichum truncatum]|uniref:Carbohydrate esterase family 9 protein n=1 Tax=Colletotrichum truncatum TaxID=5467 RepID=A0ACC3ZLK7_COLTU|nr:carbohydrate esterase family 9 protein [Colletotrichum truncatum]KAF6786965.1 carbohydrate esterase family 9 protein [Colletotrichum truncatum]